VNWLPAAAFSAAPVGDGDAKSLVGGRLDFSISGQSETLTGNIGAFGERDGLSSTCLIDRHADVEMGEPEAALSDQLPVYALIDRDAALVAVAGMGVKRAVGSRALLVADHIDAVTTRLVEQREEIDFN